MPAAYLVFPPGILCLFFFFMFNDTAPTEIYTLSLHDALPISRRTEPVQDVVLHRLRRDDDIADGEIGHERAGGARAHDQPPPPGVEEMLRPDAELHLAETAARDRHRQLRKARDRQSSHDGRLVVMALRTAPLDEGVELVASRNDRENPLRRGSMMALSFIGVPPCHWTAPIRRRDSARRFRRTLPAASRRPGGSSAGRPVGTARGRRAAPAACRRRERGGAETSGGSIPA